MREPQGERLGEIGGYWLSRRPNSPAWCRTWYDGSSRQTKRASLGTADFRDAKLKLAEWVVGQGAMPDNRPGSVALEAVLIRYYQQHACARRSGKQARYALRRWSDFFPAAVVAEITPLRLRAFAAAMRNEGVSDGTIRPFNPELRTKLARKAPTDTEFERTPTTQIESLSRSEPHGYLSEEEG